jgi:cobalt-zinc-cadmium efflux system membrane fusion protein
VVAPAADDATRLIPVHAQLDNGSGALRVHQVGSATITLGTAMPAVIVPPGAVQYDGPTAYVFVQRSPSIFRGLPVRVLGTTPDGIAVDRVIPGDAVAVTGTDVLKGNLFQDKFGPGCACGAE